MNLRYSVLLCLVFAFVSTTAGAEQTSIGYLLLPEAKKNIRRYSGDGRPVVVGGQQGEVWYEHEESFLEVRKFDVFALPDEKSEWLASIDVSGAMMELMAETLPGRYKFNSIADAREHQIGRLRLPVFEKWESWVKVRFLSHTPWNGRYGWVRLGPNTGGFIAH